MSEVNVLSLTQKIIVDPFSSAVAVINAGPQGPRGPNSTWLGAAGVPASGLGLTGDWYLNQTNGDVYQKTAGTTWTLRTNIRGPQGLQGLTGVRGSIWTSGAGVPSGALGIVGDWYLNTTNSDVYEKTGSSAWTLRDNISTPLATNAEVAAGVNTSKAVTPAGLASLTSAWTRVTFKNSWVDYEPGGAGPLTPPRYVSWRLSGDEMQIRGTMRAGTIGLAAFTLPYPPPFRMTFPATGSTQPSQVSIETNGDFIPGVGANNWFFVDGIRYSITP